MKYCIYEIAVSIGSLIRRLFQLAVTEQRSIITFDLGFGELLANSRGQLVSVILFRLRDASTQRVIEQLQ